MKRPLDKDVAAFLTEFQDFGSQLAHDVGEAHKVAINAKKLKSSPLPASGAELDEDLPDLSPGVKDK